MYRFDCIMKEVLFVAVFEVDGGRKLFGEMKIHGAKNSALPLLCAALICDGETVFHNCPDLSDVNATLDILQYLGCDVTREDSTVIINAKGAYGSKVPDELMQKMRSSVLFLGAMISKCGCARITYPGGCPIGPRPIDLHLKALTTLGVKVDERFGRIDCRIPDRPTGAVISFPFVSVGATENAILCAVKAQGVTTILNAAVEPEIIDLCTYLNKCGADIRGAGNGTVVIHGVNRLHGCTHSIIPDRIETATYMAACAVTGGRMRITQINPEYTQPVFYAFEEAGCTLDVDENSVFISAPKKLSRIKLVRTQVYPGFPTDAQAPVMAMASVANGTSIFIETIFSDRFKHIEGLTRFGAKIKAEQSVAVVESVDKLYGAEVVSPDLRSGAAYCVAALCAEGKSTVRGIHHIQRGYQDICENLQNLGANIYVKEE